jgi:hypothetical protein
MRAVLIDPQQSLAIAPNRMQSPRIAWYRGIGEAPKTEFSFRHYFDFLDVADYAVQSFASGFFACL